MSGHAKKSAILEYWRAIEFFSPQNVPKINPKNYNSPVFAVDDSGFLPWDQNCSLQKRPIPPQMKWRHTVYCGIYPLEKIRELLEKKLGADPESFDERTDNQSCVFTFYVTNEGRPLFDSFILSSCAFALGRTIKPGPSSPEWLNDLEKITLQLQNKFIENLALLPDDKDGQQLSATGIHIGRPLTYNDIVKETILISKKLKISGIINGIEIRIKSTLVSSRKQHNIDELDFINSFFINDLSMVSKEVKLNNYGAGLNNFLMEEEKIDKAKRIDIRESLTTLFSQLSPALFPPGRWPSEYHNPLVLSQQFAINSIIKDLMYAPGMFAVNGPPGTGKTTLLRDLIAGIVVERATCLSKLKSPANAFTGKASWKSNQYTRTISLWSEEFHGFEIVVASSNNGAVENITLEMPSTEAIDSSWLSYVDYFKDLSSQVINQPAWAMLTAKLGNKSNRSNFVNHFWFGDQGNQAADTINHGFDNYLKSLTGEQIDWKTAVKQFNQVLSEQKKYQTERTLYHELQLAIEALTQEVSQSSAQLNILEKNKAETVASINKIKINLLEKTKNLIEELKNKRIDHRRFQPGFFEIIFSLGKEFYSWKKTDHNFVIDINHAENTLTRIQQQISNLESELTSIESTIDTHKFELNKKQQAFTHQQNLLYQAKQQLQKFFPSLADWHLNEEAKELSSPWCDPVWNEIRARVFLEALQLHKAFITACADQIQKNLRGAIDILSGGVPADAPEAAVKAAWSTLFFVTPTISTTFASFDRLFCHLGRESLGWLLIDEAGQAAPQAAVGAIWRSKRIVVVGDPLQLEPVITIPFTAQQALRKHFQVADTWLPSNTSVQQLADRISMFGTYLFTNKEPLWVGSPLRVHRRCDQPMFDISNKLAYEGLMVFGTLTRDPLKIEQSTWLDVKSSEADSHWIPEEGRVVQQLLNSLISENIPSHEIFLISPFKVVVTQLNNIAKQYDGIKTGTIHTVQGKQSNVVILVLGGNPQKPGAKHWASKRPNLLNVAISRAKRRLYIIGNKDAWKQYPYFKIAAKILNEPIES